MYSMVNPLQTFRVACDNWRRIMAGVGRSASYDIAQSVVFNKQHRSSILSSISVKSKPAIGLVCSPHAQGSGPSRIENRLCVIMLRYSIAEIRYHKASLLLQHARHVISINMAYQVARGQPFTSIILGRALVSHFWYQAAKTVVTLEYAMEQDARSEESQSETARIYVKIKKEPADDFKVRNDIICY